MTTRAACRVVHLGRIAYADACRLQQRLVVARKSGVAPDLLLLCEHPHVLTLGRNGRIENLRATEAQLARLGVEFHRANRGGDLTYHGPGQIIGYPILRLDQLRRDVVWYVRRLEEIMIRATAAFGVEAFRVPGRTGVWTRPSGAAEEKLGAIGVHISCWVTSHGFAYNVATDLSFFDLIVPCGIAGCRVTSLEKLLGRPLIPSAVLPRITQEFGHAFGLDMQDAPPGDIECWLTDSDAHAATTVAP
jgi:lipoyl(octanoyl) transferase